MTGWILVMLLSSTPQGVGAHQPIGRYATEVDCQRFRAYVEQEMKVAYGDEVKEYRYVCLPTE